MTYDELRALHPHLGVSLYAVVPGGAVTLELIDGEAAYTFPAATAQEAIDMAFPPELPSPPLPKEPVALPLFD